jgi:hypothetical protein
MQTFKKIVFFVTWCPRVFVFQNNFLHEQGIRFTNSFSKTVPWSPHYRTDDIVEYAGAGAHVSGKKILQDTNYIYQCITYVRLPKKHN